MQDCLQSRPLVRRWMAAVAAACGAVYEEVHAVLRHAVAAGRRGGGAVAKL